MTTYRLALEGPIAIDIIIQTHGGLAFFALTASRRLTSLQMGCQPWRMVNGLIAHFCNFSCLITKIYSSRAGLARVPTVLPLRHPLYRLWTEQSINQSSPLTVLNRGNAIYTLP